MVQEYSGDWEYRQPSLTDCHLEPRSSCIYTFVSYASLFTSRCVPGILELSNRAGHYFQQQYRSSCSDNHTFSQTYTSRVAILPMPAICSPRSRSSPAPASGISLNLCWLYITVYLDLIKPCRSSKQPAGHQGVGFAPEI